ncbi:corrinoid protein [Candidatus Aminicenantes bacterium AC-708-M15]|jgi:trimethylamine corrinoid protein|nr:corrinoid protein [SCandidatus Aminicenantes bacterium Aminicenantia_JdfR_composite]MCP2597259.1 corrinoid protein [Candidatus Aminicenantes bacterium AC-335-G13]MCP2604330.1 corrinoid protein [Candidatus Aminicenantes bacterium AC-708-M15]
MRIEDLFEQMKKSIINGNKEEAERLAREAINKGLDLNEVINKGYVPGIQEVGRLWEEGEYFLPELLTSAECMKSAMSILEPELVKSGDKRKTEGKVIIGTVEGDIHDIGKNLVAAMLTANGFEVIDLGADVPLNMFVDKALEEQANIICLSALLTTTMIGQKKVVDMLKEKSLKGKIKVMVGGAPVTKEWAERIEADGYGENAMEAVKVAKNLMSR